MSTVVDRNGTTLKNVVTNQVFKQFSIDDGFEIVTCRHYRPETIDNVETFAKLVDRLKPYNEEFDGFDDLVPLLLSVPN